MDTEPSNEEPDEDKDSGGRALAIGIIGGAVLFAATDNPVWIALGVAIGAGMAAKERSSD